MPLPLSPLLERFAERTPLPVMVRALLERLLSPAELDAWFERVADSQYTRRLLFSTVFDLMSQVVLGAQPSVKAAYQAQVAEVGVSLTSVYNKLNGLEIGTSAALVRDSAEQAHALITTLAGARPEPLPGYTLRVLDGNVLGGREHRLKETRTTTAAPLPGKLLAVFAPAQDVITQIYPCEDAYTQERALLGPVLADVEARQVWLADRNFCTRGALEAIAARQAFFVIREHEGLRFTPLGAMVEAGRVETGPVAEQPVHLGPRVETDGLPLRRLRLTLDTPTRDGETELYLLTNLPAEQSALTLVDLYRQRWTLERAFLHLTTELRCEVETLAYPPAALFAFACAAVAFNVLAVVKAALRAEHGQEAAEQVSGYYLAIELGNAADTLDALVDPPDWAVFMALSVEVFADWLRAQAARLDLRRYRKSTRSAKKPTPPRTHDPKQTHVATARLLAKRKKSP